MRQLTIRCIRLYQRVLSPYLGNQCRFHPSCSHYGIEALEVHGFFKGTALLIYRLLRCHPFSKGGLDPVPTPSTVFKRDNHGL